MKVLAIDDDSTIIQMVEAVLTRCGYTALTACDGPSGIEKAQLERPHAIILDRNMPGQDGHQVLMELKADDRTRAIPVIMLTGDQRVSDVQASLDLGAVDYIVKPFDVQDFAQRVEKVLQG